MKNLIFAMLAFSTILAACGKNQDEIKYRGASTSAMRETNFETQNEKMEETIALLSEPGNRAVVSSKVSQIVKAIGNKGSFALTKVPSKKFDPIAAVNALVSNVPSLKARVVGSNRPQPKSSVALWEHTGRVAASGPGGFVGYAGSTFVDTETGLNAFVGQAYIGLAQALLLGVGQTADGGVCAAAWYLDAATTTNLISEFLSYAPLTSLLNGRVGSCCIDAAGTTATCQDITAGTPPVVYPLK